MLNLLTVLCLMEAWCVLRLTIEYLKWHEERSDDKERRDASRAMYRDHIHKVVRRLYD